jgi:ribose transport system ATP-binding protein
MHSFVGQREPRHLVQVQLRGVSKAFGPVRVLDRVDLTLSGGEIHALMGENGAGKSTLLKILSGSYRADGGEIRIDGKPVRIASPRAATCLGIAIIHQELNLIPQLSVTDNVFLGRERAHFGVLERERMRAETADLLGGIGAVRIDPKELAGALSVGRQQLVEIATALSRQAKVLIMDEPTASLTDHEIETLFAIMRTLKARGVAIVYVSHRLEEVFRICDRVSVLRDGRFVGERSIAQTTVDEIVQLMVGRELKERFPRREVSPGAVRLRVEGLADRGRIRDISFEVRAGEVLGIAGLVGAGRTRILRTLFGLSRRTAGHVSLDGAPISVTRPRDAIAAGIAFVTEDRKGQGLVQVLSVRMNASLVHLERYSRFGIIRSRSERAAVRALIDELHIRTRDSELEVKALSGGNQQKIVFAKWLAAPPRVLLLDEPTRGVDVGGKAEIYHIINRLAVGGAAILMVSSELPEVLAMSDRILVMREGRQSGIFDAHRTNQKEIMDAATEGLRL